MRPQGKDKFYDQFLQEPTKENFRKFLQENCGEMDEIDFKEQWIEKGQLAKTMLAMANSGGGVIVFGVREEQDGVITPIGLENFEDKANINNQISKYIPPAMYYEVFDFSYNAAEYSAVENKKFQLLVINDTPDRLPFISTNSTTDLEKDTIYVRRGTKCEKATRAEIEDIINQKISSIFKETSDLSLSEHLEQLKLLYDELPKKINVLIKKGQPHPLFETMGKIAEIFANSYGGKDVYEEQENPNYPDESYEAFISRMINMKKLKIEKVLDLK